MMISYEGFISDEKRNFTEISILKVYMRLKIYVLLLNILISVRVLSNSVNLLWHLYSFLNSMCEYSEYLI